ncbi:MAG: SAM-dependent methyltransferase, partial [Burkholderiales bacterium]
MLLFTGPADEMLSAYFRQHRALGQQERAFVAEASFAVLRRRRSLEAAAGSAAPAALVAAA